MTSPAFLTFLLLAVLLPRFHCYEIATVAVASVLTSVVAATDSTTAKTMSNIAGLAIFDVSDFLLLAVLLPRFHC